jgi:hypothetical protein
METKIFIFIFNFIIFWVLHYSTLQKFQKIHKINFHLMTRFNIFSNFLIFLNFLFLPSSFSTYILLHQLREFTNYSVDCVPKQLFSLLFWCLKLYKFLCCKLYDFWKNRKEKSKFCQLFLKKGVCYYPSSLFFSM